MHVLAHWAAYMWAEPSRGYQGPPDGVGCGLAGLNGMAGLQNLNGLSSLAALLGLNSGLVNGPRAGSPLHLQAPPMGNHTQRPGLSRAGREREASGIGRMVIDAGQVGMILGQGGANINQIRQV